MASDSQVNPGGSHSLTTREKLDAFCERTIFGLVLVILVWGPLAFGAVRVSPGGDEMPHLYGFLLIQGLTVLALVLWTVRLFIQQPSRLLWPPICWAVLAFVLYAIARCPQVVVAYEGRAEMVRVIVYGALFFLIVNNFNRRESATVVTMVLVAVGLGESFFAFYQFATHSDRVWSVVKWAPFATRGSGTYMNPNNFAGFVEMVLPLALAYTVMGRLSATVKVLLGYSALVMIAGVVVSQSRGGVISTAVVLVVFCVFLLFQRDYWRRGAVALAVLVAAGVVLMQQFGAVEARFNQKNEDVRVDDREMYWNAAEQIFHQHILWGGGPGQYKLRYPPYVEYRGSFGQQNPQFVHNDYLNTLCDWGLVGLAIILAALGLLFAGVGRIWPYVKRGTNELGRKNSSKAAFVLGASLSLLAILIHSVVDFNMQIPANAITAITLMALLTAHWRFGTERFWVNPGNAGRILLAVAVWGSAGYLVAQGVRAGREFYWQKIGLSGSRPWTEHETALKKAYQIEPNNWRTLVGLGECYRILAWQGDPGNEAQAREAMTWFAQSMSVNPYDAQAPLDYGRCLDWLDRPNEATHYFLLANELQPYNAGVSMYFGWHCIGRKSYALAMFWLERSQMYKPSDTTHAYWELARDKLAEAQHGTPLP